jgi:hypothetical protein
MDSSDETTSVLLLERSRPVVGSRPPVEEDDAPSPQLGENFPHREPSALPVTSGGDFRGPVLGALAAASILVGYRWLGVISVTNSRLSSLVFGRTGALAFALLALWLAWVAGGTKGTTKRARGAKGPVDDGVRRPRAARLLVLAASVSTVVAAGLILSDAAVLRYTFGVSELLVASVAGTLLLVDERRRRAGPDLPPVTASSPGHHGAATT